jgi:hypothetical protein
MNAKNKECDGIDVIHLTKDRVQWHAPIKVVNGRVP